jgi:hypothetical protein
MGYRRPTPTIRRRGQWKYLKTAWIFRYFHFGWCLNPQAAVRQFCYTHA